MLRIYSFVIETLRLLELVLREIGRSDPDLARQGKRAASSIALNTAEGYGNMDGNRRLRYRTALGSAQEVKACLDIAEALAYAKIEPELRDRFDRIAATMYRLAT